MDILKAIDRLGINECIKEDKIFITSYKPLLNTFCTQCNVMNLYLVDGTYLLDTIYLDYDTNRTIHQYLITTDFINFYKGDISDFPQTDKGIRFFYFHTSTYRGGTLNYYMEGYGSELIRDEFMKDYIFKHELKFYIINFKKVGVTLICDASS